ncbi:hypothetical protein MTO96_017435 [Rhipicephalus appendiculatus]
MRFSAQKSARESASQLPREQRFDHSRRCHDMVAYTTAVWPSPRAKDFSAAEVYAPETFGRPPAFVADTERRERGPCCQPLMVHSQSPKPDLRMSGLVTSISDNGLLPSPVPCNAFDCVELKEL